MIRDASGMSSPASPSGYPLPSQFSCEARTTVAMLRSAGDARRIRSPTMVCCRTNAHSRSSSGPGLREDLVRHRELAEVVELGGSVELLELVSAESEHPPDLRCERADADEVLPKPGRAPERFEQRRHRPVALAPARVLLRIEPLIGGLQRVSRVGRLVREHDGAERRLDLEPFALLGERGARAVDERLGLTVRDRREEAELVPAEPISGTFGARYGREFLAEAREQRVAGRVAERVVVALESVEVEQHEECRPHGVGAQTALEVGEQLATIAEPRQRIRGRFPMRELEEAAVLAERHRQPDDDQRERGRRRARSPGC